MAFGSNIDQRKKNKRNHVVDLFRRSGMLSKIQARKLSGYSMNTILTIFDSLIEEKLIVEVEGAQKPLGRKATFYRLNDRKMLYLGITFNQSGIYSSLMSFSHGLLESHETGLKTGISRDLFVEELRRHIDEILERNHQYRSTCVAAGLSVPGDIDTESGVLRSYTLMPGLNGLNFREILQTDLPKKRVHIDHNIRSMTSYFLLERQLVEDYRKILFISARSGTANGLISGGAIVTAHGEFGHVRVSDEPVKCICGRTGCLDHYFSYNSFIRLIRDKVNASFEDTVKTGEMGGLSVLARLYGEGDSEIRKELDSRLCRFAMAMLDVINVTVPDLVILSGELLKVYGDPVEALKRVITPNFADSGYVPHYRHARFQYRELGTEIASLGICHGMIREDWDYIPVAETERE